MPPAPLSWRSVTHGSSAIGRSRTRARDGAATARVVDIGLLRQRPRSQRASASVAAAAHRARARRLAARRHQAVPLTTRVGAPSGDGVSCSNSRHRARRPLRLSCACCPWASVACCMHRALALTAGCAHDVCERGCRVRRGVSGRAAPRIRVSNVSAVIGARTRLCQTTPRATRFWNIHQLYTYYTLYIPSDRNHFTLVGRPSEAVVSEKMHATSSSFRFYEIIV